MHTDLNVYVKHSSIMAAFRFRFIYRNVYTNLLNDHSFCRDMRSCECKKNFEVKSVFRLLLQSLHLHFTASVPASDIRLVGGSGPHEGRVEIQYNGVWGTVDNTATYWNTYTHFPEKQFSASVICRQLGYGDAGSYETSTDVFGPGTGVVWDIGCITVQVFMISLACIVRAPVLRTFLVGGIRTQALLTTIQQILELSVMVCTMSF